LLSEGFGMPIGAGEVTDVELYDLEQDPRQLTSRHADPAYTVIRAALAGAVAELRGCAGDECDLRLVVPPPG
jgi:hypothetical protein